MSDPSRFDALAASAERYGRLSLENYAIIRGVAENLADGFCAWLGGDGPRCVYLVPPEGAWTPQSYRSGACSVSGKNFLPLSPISFGLAVKVSHTGDWLRMVLTCAKKGPVVEVSIAKGSSFNMEQMGQPWRSPTSNANLAVGCFYWAAVAQARPPCFICFAACFVRRRARCMWQGNIWRPPPTVTWTFGGA